MKTDREGNKLIVDIHGMRTEPAKFRLESTVNSCSDNITEIVVIHGFNQGQALKEMVKGLVSSKISNISPSLLNEGQTVISLRRKK